MRKRRGRDEEETWRERRGEGLGGDVEEEVWMRIDASRCSAKWGPEKEEEEEPIRRR